jgi:tRNA (guanine-N7-)-methyltransferase
MRMRKKPNLVPRIERCGDIFLRQPEAYRGQRLKAFPEYRELYLEIGCGKGRFTTETALSMPDTLFVAVERVADAMIIGMERAVRDNIRNVRFIKADVSSLTDMFGPGEVARIYINFCDPWPGTRHQKRRLTSEGFLRLYRQILRPGGEIHFKTDNDPLFEFSLASFTGGGFDVTEVTRNLHEGGCKGVMTDYEQKFHAQGVSINRCVATLKAAADTSYITDENRKIFTKG